jgi:hypothetical protein
MIPQHIITVLRWFARIGSLASVGMLLLFIGEGLVGGSFDRSQMTWMEWSTLIVFPGGVLLGMLIGWFREEIGGSITAGSLLAFSFVETVTTRDIASGPWFVLFATPGILFLLCWFLSPADLRRCQTGD